jgi:hypothetical protein
MVSSSGKSTPLHLAHHYPNGGNDLHGNGEKPKKSSSSSANGGGAAVSGYAKRKPWISRVGKNKSEKSRNFQPEGKSFGVILGIMVSAD